MIGMIITTDQACYIPIKIPTDRNRYDLGDDELKSARNETLFCT